LNRLTEAQLDYLCDSVSKLFDGTLPRQLLEFRYGGSGGDASAALPGSRPASVAVATTPTTATALAAAPKTAAELEAALIAPPTVLAVLSDVGGAGSDDGTGRSSGADTGVPEPGSLRESRLSIVLTGASTPRDRPASRAVLRQRFQTIVGKCTLQLLLIQTVNDLVSPAGPDHFHALGPTRLLAIAANLERSYRFASSFNGNKSLRAALAAAGA
jgi:hypothetical protein